MIEFPGKRHGFFNPGVNNGIDFKETLYLADLFLLYHGFVNGAPQVYSDERDVPQLDYGLSSRGLMAGEVRDTSVVLRSEIVVAPNSKDFQDLFNMTKKAIFELDTSKRFISPLKSEMIETSSLKDNVAEISFTGLIPATRYYYRMRYGIRKTSVLSGTGTFKTLGNKENTSRKFIMYTGAHYSRFFKMHQTQNNHLKDDLHPFERLLGFPGHKKILELSPDFVIGNGDNVYYDHVHPTPALTKEEMRKVWHRMYDLPRFSELLKCVPFYFMKDDHDFRYNDSDTTSNPSALPTVDAGKYIFREQTSIPDREDYKTYRTVKIHPQCQIWMLEGRDYRSPNTMPDNRKKSMLGKEQKDWLKRTLKSSKAKYKLIISPVPFIGPDDAYKKDNFTNPGGFRSERQALFEWLLDHNFGPSNTLFLCGDRHWQYHSVHPSGFHEFSCGALVDENARLGRLPGDENSTDPQGLIVQPYTQKHPSGGFLEVVVINSTEEETALQFKFYDESGKMLYQYMYE
jgi:alkaline phosphatase/alkaline phosphatase D